MEGAEWVCELVVLGENDIETCKQRRKADVSFEGRHSYAHMHSQQSSAIQRDTAKLVRS